MFVERCELGPSSRDGDGIPRPTVSLGIVEQTLERECQPTTKTRALRLEPQSQRHLDAVVGVGEKVALPACHGLTISTGFDVALEEIGVHLEVAEVELHGVMRDAQSVADESMQFEQRLAK
jgi:hypothetical protein